MREVKVWGWRMLVLLMPLAAFTACDDDDDDNDSGRLTSSEFVQRAAASDMFEIETGNQAVQKSTLQEVRDFGQEIVNDHTASSTVLKTLATAKNITVPTTLPQDKAAIRDRLAGKTGTAFDKDFADVQVQAHQEAVDLYEEASEELEDEELQAFAEQTLPVLRMHLQHAQELKTITDQL